MVKKPEHILANPAVYCMSLYIAAQNGSRDIAKYISELPVALPSPEDMDKYTAYFFALQNGHTDIFKRICENNIGKRLTYRSKNTDPIPEKIEVIPVKKELIKSDKCKSNVSIFEATIRGDVNLVKRLLENGVNAKSIDEHHNTPMHYAAKYNHGDISDLLIRCGTAACTNDRGNTPLHFAALNGCTDIAKNLIANNSPINAKNLCGNTPLHYAVINGHEAIVQLLLENNAEHCINFDKNWPLLYSNDIKTVEVFLNNNVDINYTDKNGNSLLHCAIKNGNLHLAEYLIERGIFLSIKNSEGEKAIHLAVKREGMRNIIKLLLMKGEIIDLTDPSGETFLHEAIKKRYNELLPLLLPNVDIEAETVMKETALHYACKLNNEFAVQLLLEKDANVNAKCILGRKPADLAKIMGNLNISRMLLEKNPTGFNFSSVNNSIQFNFTQNDPVNFAFQVNDPVNLGAIPKRIPPKLLIRRHAR